MSLWSRRFAQLWETYRPAFSSVRGRGIKGEGRTRRERDRLRPAYTAGLPLPQREAQEGAAEPRHGHTRDSRTTQRRRPLGRHSRGTRRKDGNIGEVLG